jgi:RNA polymerase sigma-70 factor (ECF subfamily)
LPDAVLVTGYKEDGNQQYLLALYQRYAGLLFGVCYKYLKNADDARDACAEIYTELVSKLLKYDVDNFKGWLHMLAKNHCLQKIRSAKNIHMAPLPETFVQLEDPLHLEDVLKREANLGALEKCLELLQAEQQQMVKLFYLEDKCYNEITEITGQPWNTVRSNIQNGRRNLKICIEKQSSE